MNNILLLAFLGILISCGTKPKIKSSNKVKLSDIVSNELPKPDSSISTKSNFKEKPAIIYLSTNYGYSKFKYDTDSFPVTNQYLNSNVFYDILRDSLSLSNQLYDKVSHLMDKNGKQVAILMAIKGNNHKLVKKAYTDLLNECFEIKGSKLEQRIKNPKNRLFTLEKGDSIILKWVINQVGWLPLNKMDSLFHFTYSAENSNYSLLKYYLDNGWKTLINSKYYYYGSGDNCEMESLNGWTALEKSVQVSDTISANLLIEYGAYFDKKTLTVWSDSIGTRFIFKKLLNKGYTKKELLDSSLFYASRWGMNQRVKPLLELGADPNFKDNNQETAIFYTIKNDECGGVHKEQFRVLKRLLQYNAKVNIKNNKGETPLMLSTLPACGDGCAYRLGFIKVLLKNGARTDIRNNQGRSVWDYISNNNSETLVRYFVNRSEIDSSYKVIYDSILRTRVWESTGYIFDPEEKKVSNIR